LSEGLVNQVGPRNRLNLRPTRVNLFIGLLLLSSTNYKKVKVFDNF
jgi:hypothetical protein